MALDAAYPAPGLALSTMTQWEALFARTTVDGVVSGIGCELPPVARTPLMLPPFDGRNIKCPRKRRKLSPGFCPGGNPGGKQRSGCGL
jgi:hypothetical protein